LTAIGQVAHAALILRLVPGSTAVPAVNGPGRLSSGATPSSDQQIGWLTLLGS
jgi:hypothetical protein